MKNRPGLVHLVGLLAFESTSGIGWIRKHQIISKAGTSSGVVIYRVWDYDSRQGAPVNLAGGLGYPKE